MPTLKILVIGTSIEAGDEANPLGFRCFRGPLQARLAAAGYSVDFVGRNRLPPASGGTDPDCEAYGGAYISDAGVGAMNANNNLQDRIAAMKSEIGAVDVIIAGFGWNDVYNQPTNASSRATTLISTIHSTTWASAKLVLLTMHPERNKTAAQTDSDNSAWGPINAAIRAGVSASPTTRFLVDRANLTGAGDAAAFLETLLYDAQNRPDATTTKGGNGLGMPAGGHLVTSFKSMQDYCSQWSTTVAVRRGPNGNIDDQYTDPNVPGHPFFINSVQAVVPWLWTFAGPGHASSNTVLEARNMFAGARRKSNGQYGFFFSGARPGASGIDNFAVYNLDMAGATSGVRDGITSWYRVDGNTNIEAWPADTVPSRGVEGFFGGRNRSLMADAEFFFWGCQVRLAKLDSAGTDDTALARFLVGCGADFSTGFSGAYGNKRYDYYGWPLQMMDGGHDRYKFIRSTDWVWVGGNTIGRNTASWLGPNSTEHFEDPGLQPPLSNWAVATPYNDMPTYSITVASLRANPPPLPPYVSGSTSSAGGWTSTDYFDSIHLSQAGADKDATAIFDVMVASGVLGSSSGGGTVSISLLPGIPPVGAWAARYVTEATTPATATWGGIEVATNAAPVWSTRSLPNATVGTTYVGTAAAIGSPTPTYSIVSGPAWLTINSTTGALGGTVGATEGTFTVVLRATNAAAPSGVDITLTITVSAAFAITTTSPLPDATVGTNYNQPIGVVGGVAPYSYSVSAGSLLSGFVLSSSAVVGNAAAPASSSFTVTVVDSAGTTISRAFTLAAVSGAGAPVITTTALSDATAGTAGTRTITASGDTPLTWSVPYSSVAGVTIGSSTGVLSYPALSQGSVSIAVTATNAKGTTTKTFTLRANAPDATPTPKRYWIGPGGGGASWRKSGR